MTKTTNPSLPSRGGAGVPTSASPHLPSTCSRCRRPFTTGYSARDPQKKDMCVDDASWMREFGRKAGVK